MDKKQPKAYFMGWKNVALFFVIMSFIGVVFYSVSIIFPAMLRERGWTRGSASLALTLNVLLMGFFAPVIAISIDRIGNRRTLTTGLMITFIIMLLLYTTTYNLWMWTVLWGMLAPVGMAFGSFVPIITNLMLWFNIRRATVMGIVTTGFAIGGFIAQPLYAWLISATGTWRIGWLANAIVSFIALLLSFSIIEKPADVGQYPDGLNPHENESGHNRVELNPRTYRSSINWTLKMVFKNPVIWLLFIVNMGYLQALFLINSHGLLHFTDIGFTPMQAASILGVIILSSGIAGIPMGVLADRIEPRWIIAFAMAMMCFMFLALWKASNLVSLVAAGSVFGFCYGTIGLVTTTMIGNYFGPESFPKINGVLGPMGTITSAIVPLIAGLIADRTGNYDMIFAFISIVLLCGSGCGFLLKPPILKREVSL